MVEKTGKSRGGKIEKLTVHELRRTVEAYEQNEQSVHKTSDAMGLTRPAIRYRLKKAADHKMVLYGRAETSSDHTKVYILTSAQDDTPVFKKFWENLLVYKEHREAELIVGGYTYQKGLYESHNTQEAVFSHLVEPYMSDEKRVLAPGLMWVGDANILPTAVNPLSGWETMSRDSWAILPHSKIALQSIATLPGALPKQIMSTGTVTDPNYIQKNAGKKAEFHHTAGAVVVEVMSDGTFFCRHINAEPNGSFYDLDTYVSGGLVTDGHSIEAVTWGDIHCAKLDDQVAHINWGMGGNIIDTLRPKYQFMHDLLDFEARNHHNRSDPHFRAEMQAGWGHNLVEDEIREVAAWVNSVDRDFCEMVVVESNHDQALNRWLKDQKVADDHQNARYWHELNAEIYLNIEAGEKNFNAFEYACRAASDTKLDGVTFITGEQSFRICQGTSPIETSIHGHKGVNGSRGSPQQYTRVATKINVGHTHSPLIKEGVYQAGVSGKLKMGYNNEAFSTWDHAHIVTYPNGKRAIITIRNGRWRG